MNQNILQFYDYHVWATRKLIEHLKEVPQDIYEAEFQSVFSSFSQALSHIYRADNVWLAGISGESFDNIRAKAFQWEEELKGLSLEEIRTKFEELFDRYRSSLHQRMDGDTKIEFKHPSYGSLKTNIFEIVQNVVNHGTYHRGNITDMLRQKGHPGTPTDYIVYLYTLNRSE
ncbi:DinB family protein [Paenibacillus sp. sptzw28]|nr:DinB family protein [Paenibacillus sp. sptzw28]